MFVSFDEVFNSKPAVQTKVPYALVDEFNKELPNGVKYEATDDGKCVLTSTSEDNSIKFSGFKFAPSKIFLKALGDNYTPNDVLAYSYNTQAPIPIEFIHDGYISISGKEMPIETLEFNPYKPFKYVKGTGKCFALPAPFPPAHDVYFGTIKYMRGFKMQRVVNDSLDIIAFESENGTPIKIKYFANKKTDHFDINVTIKLELAKSIRDIVESVSIYNSFIDGSILLNGNHLGEYRSLPDKDKYNEESVIFWEKVLQIEEALSIKFIPSLNNISHEVTADVEELYQNIILNTPTRTNHRITSFDGDLKFDSNKKIDAELNKPTLIHFMSKAYYELFGVKFALPCFYVIFNAVFSSFEPKGKKYRIFLDDVSSDNKMYVTMLSFKSQKELTSFDTNNENIIPVFQDAKNPSEYY